MLWRDLLLFGAAIIVVGLSGAAMAWIIGWEPLDPCEIFTIAAMFVVLNAVREGRDHA